MEVSVHSLLTWRETLAFTFKTKPIKKSVRKLKYDLIHPCHGIVSREISISMYFFGCPVPDETAASHASTFRRTASVQRDTISALPAHSTRGY